jgi:hypothetical protein
LARLSGPHLQVLLLPAPAGDPQGCGPLGAQATSSTHCQRSAVKTAGTRMHKPALALGPCQLQA